MARRPRRHAAAIAALIVLALAVVGCDAATATPSPPAASRVETTGSALSSTPPNAVDPVLAMASGAWRAIPVVAPRTFGAPFEAGCRAKEPALDGFLRVLVDVRGANVVHVVFVRDGVAYLCRTRVDSPGTPDAITKLDVPAASLPDDGIDIVRYQLIDTGDSARTILVGRVGPLAAYVIAGFDDESYIFGTQSGGWYAMWWPGTALMAGVASTDTRHAVLSETEAIRQ